MTDGRQGGHLFDDEDLKQFRYAVAVRHVGGVLVVERGEELAGWRFPLGEARDFVQLGAGDGDVRLHVVLRGRVAELGVEEEGEQGCGDDVGGDGLLVVLRHPELSRP